MAEFTIDREIKKDEFESVTFRICDQCRLDGMITRTDPEKDKSWSSAAIYDIHAFGVDMKVCRRHHLGWARTMKALREKGTLNAEKDGRTVEA